ncbi:MAG: YwiC-like family protein [Acidimicrobiales bacterium]
MRVQSRPASAAASVPWRSVALPSEHGGWSLTAEPILLGLLVSWSWPGLALGVSAVVAFLARTPLKIVLVDRWRRRWLDRTALAAKIAGVQLVIIGGLLIFVTTWESGRFWLPFAMAAPLVGLELWYDRQSRGRRLLPELAGSIGIGAVAAAIALVDGSSHRLAFGLWMVIALRSISAIPYVRHQIAQVHARYAPSWRSDGAQLLATVGAVAAWRTDLVPVGALLALAFFSAINVVMIRLPSRPAVVIGVQQTIVGITIVVATAITVTT